MVVTSMLSWLCLLAAVIRSRAANDDCGAGRAPFRVELLTDYYPVSMYWKVFDISNKDDALHEGTYDYYSTYTLHEHNECLDSGKCYQFVIVDYYGDGMCCYYGEGYYKVYYDNEIVSEGSEFESTERSARFGGGCPSAPAQAPSDLPPTDPPTFFTSYEPTPTFSTDTTDDTIDDTSVPTSAPISDEPTPSLSTGTSMPTNGTPSMNPTDTGSFSPSIGSTHAPSGTASYPPSESSTPTTILSARPSFAPTITPNPTVYADTNYTSEPDSYNGRLRYPLRVNRTQLAIQAVPNCTDQSGRVGCVALPRTSPLVKPDWVGKIRHTPPECKQNLYGRNTKCTLGLPTTITPLPDDFKSSIFPGFREEVFSGENAVDVKAIVVGDFNMDGFLDIVMGFNALENVLYMNNGNNNINDKFTKLTLPGGKRLTRSIALGDLNDDGRLDIVIGNRFDINQLLLNLGNSSFEELQLPGVRFDSNNPGAETAAIEVADMNGDGKLDIVVGNDKQMSQILLNKGDGKSYELTDITEARVSSIAVGDLDNDQQVDIVFGLSEGKNLIAMNKEQFHIQTLGPESCRGVSYCVTTSVQLGDMDGDGNLDIIVGNSEGANTIYQNNGYGNYTSYILPGGEVRTDNLELGDIDGDGKVDLLVLNRNDDKRCSDNHLLFNRGNGAYELIELFSCNGLSIAAAFGDFDNDGFMDFTVGMANGTENRIFMNGGDVAYDDDSAYVIRELPNQRFFSPRAVALGDINGDGILDMVVGNSDSEPNQIYLSNNNKGTYEAKNLPGGTLSTSAIAIGDLNGDGELDVVVGNIDSYDQVLLLLGSGDGNFELKPLLDESVGYTGLSSIALGDIDGDTFLDIVVSYDGVDEIYYNNENNGNFTVEQLGDKVGARKHTHIIALGDLDGDGLLDIVIGNDDDGEIPVLRNEGSRIFDPSYFSLRGTDLNTPYIALGDINNDTLLDIVAATTVGRSDVVLINNKDGTFTSTVLPESNYQTESIALGDFNGDDLVDIVIGSKEITNRLYLNNGNDGLYSGPIDIPGTNQKTHFVSLADLDGDGVIEIVAMNKDAPSQVIFHSSCPNGGARPYVGSWCIRCPTYMGRSTFLNYEQSSCLECLPDYEQQEGIGERCAPERCFLSERPLGAKECSRCGIGTYYDNNLNRTENDIDSWQPQRCVSCPKGRFADESLIAINECYACPSGEYQPEEGKGRCEVCSSGTFQPDRGQATCNPCEAGGYCDKYDLCNGGFVSCVPGTYNELEGQNNITACIACEAGTFSTVTAATTNTTCKECPAGSFGNSTGQTECELCPPGTYQPLSGQTRCLECPTGTYTDKEGMFKCVPCPYRLSSYPAATTCAVCDDKFYLDDATASPNAIFLDPIKYCLDCPREASCPMNTTLQTIKVPAEYWRDSFDTSALYLCDNDVCRGSVESENRRLQVGNNFAPYCEEGHAGPLCELCLGDMQWFNPLIRRCDNCPTFWQYAIITLSLAIIVLALFFFTKIPIVKEKVNKVQIIFATLSAQAKFKLVISFYQVVNTLQVVYGVTVDRRLQAWFNFLSWFDFSFDVFIPGECVGSMDARMVINAVWPWFVIFIGFIAIAIHARCTKEKILGKNEQSLKATIFGRTVKFTIFFMYLVLPGVTRGIFDVWKCQEYKTNDKEELYNKYLIADLTLFCESENSDYSSVLRLFWGFFFLWPVFVPLGALGLLWKVRKSVHSRSTTPLAEACSFLWRDYNENMMFWEIFDLYRKIFLTGVMLWIDPGSGSRKILRLLLAILISLLYFGFLLRARPYKRSNDLDLSFVSNLLLLCCFVLGISLNICQNEDNCTYFISSNITSIRATIGVVVLTGLLLLATLIFLIFVTMSAIVTPSVRLVSSGSKPNLEMQGDCNFHAFLSHIWSTGKDKTHTIARKTQLLLPGVKIWLDVDNLAQMDQLETSVKESTVILIFYSGGYFRSRNCRREVYAAVKYEKPIYLIYQGDEFDVELVKDECRKYCKDGDDVVSAVFAKPPILWLGSGGAHYAIEAVKLISMCIISHLPYYTRIPGQLTPGLKVSGELGPVEFSAPVDIYVCPANVGARRVIEEAKAQSARHARFLNVLDASIFLNLEELFSDDSVSLNKKFLLVYLDEDVFLDEDDELANTVRSAVNMGIQIVNVHELDVNMGACKFDDFFTQTPDDLIGPPYDIFKDIAVPLYALPAYRKISLRQLLMKFGASENKKANDTRRRNTRLFFGSSRFSFLNRAISGIESDGSSSYYANWKSSSKRMSSGSLTGDSAMTSEKSMNVDSDTTVNRRQFFGRKNSKRRRSFFASFRRKKDKNSPEVPTTIASNGSSSREEFSNGSSSREGFKDAPSSREGFSNGSSSRIIETVPE